MSQIRRALVVGAGQRVREAALPAFQQADDLFHVEALVARSERELEVQGRTYPVRNLAQLGPADLEGIDLVFLCVSKDAIPKVLARLAALGPARCELLIDTPVVRFKHFRATRWLDAFARVGVAEDCTTLPWVPLLRECVEAGEIGELREVVFRHSAWAYHGQALAKALLGEPRVDGGRRVHQGGEAYLRTLRLGRRRAVVHEPRDYASGSFRMYGSAGSVGDDPAEEGLLVEPVREAGRVAGFRIGAREVRLDAQEAALMEDARPEARVTGLMEPAKRVGFLRLLRSIHAGHGAYPLLEGLDDMVVDYHLEKFGRYVQNPFTSPRGALGRALLRRVTKG